MSDVQFSANGRRLFTSGNDRVIRAWYVETDELITDARRLAFRGFNDVERQRYAPLLR